MFSEDRLPKYKIIRPLIEKRSLIFKSCVPIYADLSVKLFVI